MKNPRNDDTPRHDARDRTRLTYRDAGVDIDKADAALARIRRHAARTLRPGVLDGVGGFGGLFALDTKKYPQPVLVAGADGVGTKLQLAVELNEHGTIGEDCVAMCVNDIIVQGAEPLFFLDYIACGRLDPDVVEQIVAGVADGCSAAGCALLGGETAEMPGSYPPGEYDIAGFAVGVVNEPDVIDGRDIRPGDVIVGFGASGVHSNGYSLVRRALELAAVPLDATPSSLGGRTIGEELLRPTRIYAATVAAVRAKGLPVKGMAHITGGGLTENVPRCLPAGTAAVLEPSRWPRLPVFDLIQQWGNVAEDEMRRTFNCGIGFIVVAAADVAPRIAEEARAAGEEAYVIGEIVAGNREVSYR